MKNYYFILDGKIPKPVDGVMEWANWYEKADRTVKKTELHDCKVSTVFLGINHAFAGGAPILFETMIFGGEHDGHCERCSTWEEAEQEHQKAIELVFAV
jgi:hypothetical protein